MSQVLMDYEKVQIQPAGLDTYVNDEVIVNGSYTPFQQPTLARNIEITVTDGDSSISAGIITVSGTDINNNTIEETFDLSTSLTFTGDRNYKTISSIVVSDLVGNDGADTLKILSGKYVQITGGRSTLISAMVTESSIIQIGKFYLIDGDYTQTDANIATIKQGITPNIFTFNCVVSNGLRVFIDGDVSLILTYKI